MAWYTPVVEINFADLNAAENWIDVTAYVQTITTNRGRHSELDRFSGGTMNVVLNNEDRRFDPAYTSSPYNPNVKPRRKIRLKVTIGVTTHTIFTGYISGWPQNVNFVTGISTVQLECYDAFTLLAQQKLSGSIYAAYMASLAPLSWYRLVDDTTDSLVMEEYGRSTMSVYGSAKLQTESGSPVPDVSKCVYFDGHKGGIRSDDGIMAEPWSFGSIIWSMKCADRAAYAKDVSSTVLVMDATVWDMGGLLRCNLDMPDETTSGNLGYRGKLYVQLIKADYTVTATVQTPGSILDNQWHHFCLTFSGSTVYLYMDGVEVDWTNSFNGQVVSFTSPSVFGERFTGGAPVTRGFIGYLADWSVIPFVLGSTTVAELHQAWLGFPGQLSSDRAKIVLDFAGWPLLARDIQTSQTRLRPMTTVFDGSVLDALQKIAETENGGVYIKPNGDVKFRIRYELIRDYQIASVTFGDGTNERRYLDAQLTMDEQFLFNEATMGVEGGRTYTIVDSASQDKYGPRAHPERTGLLSLTDNDAISGGEYIVQNYATPLNRIPAIKVDPRFDLNNFTWCVALVLGERIAVKRKPQNLGTVWTVDTYIESINHEIDLTQRTWFTTFGLNQKGAKNTNYAVFGAWIVGTNPMGW